MRSQKFPGKNSAETKVERMTGIEPAYSAWEADVLPLNYIRLVTSPASIHNILFVAQLG
jgi:hypothetical protein